MTLTDALHERGMRVTPQRLVIHEALQHLDRHATAEQVRDEVAGRLPGVSLPTVYATLDLLEELGLARRVRAGSGAVLYDPHTKPHQHALCRSCGTVEDLEADVDATGALTAARQAGFEPEGADTVVTGLCAACAAVEARRTAA
ncbi:MAG TPA: Fur family transcriptional regulator [Solirubrobacteraceae bacterium]|jgi:Fe2+ or Zn2+ uptake regulation protein|nr:Fur family transcriptional regulator [Solirubrobacteraceae bacterium]